MSATFACRFCGAVGEIYESIEIHYEGSREIEIGHDASGAIVVLDHGTPERDSAADVDSNHFACAKCSKTALKIEDIAMLAGSDCDLKVGALVMLRDAAGAYRRNVIEVVGSGDFRRVKLEHEGEREFRLSEIEVVAA